DLPPKQTFNFMFEYGLFILIIVIYFYIQDWENLRLKRYSFPQRVLGNESWAPQFIYPNHWRGGSTTNVSRQ
ncbi:6217_t:CDS:2, partial [Dentiscutata heterogama]